MRNLQFLNFVIWTIYYFILLVVATANNNVMANQSANNQGFPAGESGEFKLTKLLNIEVGGDSERLLNEDLRNTVLTEIKKGIRNELSSSAGPLEPVPTTANYNQEELIAILKEFISEVSTLKKNMSDIAKYLSSEYLPKSAVLDLKSYPVGVSFHQSCYSNALNKEISQSGKYFPRSCREIQEQGNNVSGVYSIQPRKANKPFMVLCDMETKGGGWTHIQKRYDGSVEFFVGWHEYKFGFGYLDSEFWIGLENIYKMTGVEVNELLVEIVDRENKTAYAHYKAFGLGSEAEGYSLNMLRDFSGDAGDSLTYHLGSKFSTMDYDQDAFSSNCADIRGGAWWYKDCFKSNLNGKYINVVTPDQYKYKGMFWATYRGDVYIHAKSRMMIRPAV